MSVKTKLSKCNALSICIYAFLISGCQTNAVTATAGSNVQNFELVRIATQN